jgi:hypothetical protein
MSNIVEVEVIIEKFGNYSKGDKLKMYNTTADACVKNKAVKLVSSKKESNKEPKED